MKYALFSGCTVQGRGRNYEMATREVAKVLGIELVDLDEFECCGFPIKSVHYDTYFMMAARNIFVAEQKGLDICTLCTACNGSLTEVNRHMIERFEDKARILARLKKQGIDYRLNRDIKIRHFTRILFDEITPTAIEKKIKKRLTDFKLAPHYGCHYLKPAEIYDFIEDPENPHTLDDLIRATGAESIDYPNKARCCGAGVLALNEDVAYSLAQPKLHELAKDSVDAMVLMCPFCSVMFDDNQRKIEQKYQEQYNLPVLYYPQLLGLALGIDEKALGLRMNRVSTKAFLEKIRKIE